MRCFKEDYLRNIGRSPLKVPSFSDTNRSSLGLLQTCPEGRKPRIHDESACINSACECGCSTAQLQLAGLSMISCESQDAEVKRVEYECQAIQMPPPQSLAVVSTITVLSLPVSAYPNAPVGICSSSRLRDPGLWSMNLQKTL